MEKSSPREAARARRRSRRVRACCCVAGLVALAVPAQADTGTPMFGGPAPEVSLAELMAVAERDAPGARLAAGRRAYADAAHSGADPLFSQNPTAQLGIGPRFAGNSRGLDVQAALGQPIEVAGERGLRLDAARHLRDQLDAEAAAARWDIRREVTLAYRLTSVAQFRVTASSRWVALADEMLAIARRRLEVGDIGVIDFSIAQVDAAHARQAMLSAEQELRAVQLRLCEVSGWPLEEPPNVGGSLEPRRAVPALVELLSRANEQHPQLRAGRAASAEAVARARLADREAWPAPTLGVQYTREGSLAGPANHIVLGTLGLPLPLWQSNQAERARTRVDAEVARIEAAASAQHLRLAIARAHSDLESASARIELFNSTIKPALETGLTSLQRGFEAGEIGARDFALAGERFLSAERDALAAHADYVTALSELESALGGPLEGASRGAVNAEPQ